MSTHTFLCKSANGMSVVYDPLDSHTATHFKDAPGLREQVIELLGKKELIGELVAEDIDTGRIVGNTDVVEVGDKDKIVYAMRAKREDQGYVPFTKSRDVKPSSLISIYLVRKDPATYELASTWIGEYDSPMFPQMSNATKDSIPYWSKHAFVRGSQEIIPGTERDDCPW
jgi:hypothetical protein